MAKVIILVFLFYFLVLPAIRRMRGDDFRGWDHFLQTADTPERILAVSTILGMRMGAVDGRFDPSEIKALLQSLQQVAFNTNTARMVEQVVRDVSRGQLRALDEGEIFQKFSVDPQSPAAKSTILKVLVDVARADGIIGEIEQKYFVHVAGFCGVGASEAISMLQQGTGQSDTGGQRQQRSRPQNPDAMADAYDALGLQPGASQDQIKSRYRELAKQLHPDKVAHLGGEIEKIVSEKFVRIQAAYETLRK